MDQHSAQSRPKSPWESVCQQLLTTISHKDNISGKQHIQNDHMLQKYNINKGKRAFNKLSTTSTIYKKTTISLNNEDTDIIYIRTNLQFLLNVDKETKQKKFTYMPAEMVRRKKTRQWKLYENFLL